MRRILRPLFLIVASLSLALAGCSSGDDGPAPTPDADVTVPDADVTLPDALPSTALGYMSPCDVSDDQCDTAEDLICFGFNNNGPHCTHACSGDEDCAAPSRGCGGMGVCSPPLTAD